MVVSRTTGTGSWPFYDVDAGPPPPGVVAGRVAWAAPPGGTGGTGPPLSKVSGVQYPAILGEAGDPIGSRLYIIIRHIYWIVV